jgi:hypothetical protein
VGCAGQVLLQNVGVGRIDKRTLVGAAKQFAGMPHKVLIQRVVLGNEDR